MTVFLERPTTSATDSEVRTASLARHLRARDPWPDNVKLVLVGLVVLGHTSIRGIQRLLVRLALYAVGTALTLSVLAVVPGRRRWYTAVGAASLYVYLLHGFVVRAAARSGLLDQVTAWPLVAGVVLAAAGVTLLLGSGPVRRLTRPLVEPRLDGLLRKV
jgi:fucose 4-O-acetylase-like acetyltransferase